MTPETCNSPDTSSNISGTEEAQAVNVALLPCPFCGSANVKLRTSKSEMSWVACVACGLDAPTETGQTEAEAVAYWNRRTSPALPQDVAALVDKAEALRGDLEAHNFDDAIEVLDGFRALILSQSSTIASAREVIEQLLAALKAQLAYEAAPTGTGRLSWMELVKVRDAAIAKAEGRSAQ